MILKDLIEFGLTDKEAKSYLALLELEVAGVQDIAKKAGINRSSAYVTLESLGKRGLVSISDDKSVRRYVVTSPDALLRIAEDEAAKKERLKKRMEKILPEMKALSKATKKKPIVKVFEGKSGLIAAFEDSLESEEKLIRVSSSVGNLFPIIPHYLTEYIRKRIEKGIRMRGMHPDDEVSEQLTKILPKGFDATVSIPKGKCNFLADVAVYDDKIGYMSHQDGGMAIIIESKEIADAMKNIFDLAYEEAKRIAPKAKANKGKKR